MSATNIVESFTFQLNEFNVVVVRDTSTSNDSAKYNNNSYRRPIIIGDSQSQLMG